MTETEWLTATDREQALAFLGTRLSARKRRLFACACCRRFWDWVEDTPAARTIETAEAYADGFATADELRDAEKAAAETASQFYQDYRQTNGLHPYIAHIHASACADAAAPPGSGTYANKAANFAAQTHAYEAIGATQPHDSVWNGHKAVEAAVQTALLRDIVGNPFRIVMFDAVWRTDTALILARQMYESREFSAAPILADALQDAGCDSDDILNHLRDENATHVRGCWAIDLVLGKE